MGTLVGHVAPGTGFLLVGLWHLYNHIRLFLLRPTAYVAPVWFPVRRARYLELALVIAGAVASILMELVVGPADHAGVEGQYHLLLQGVVAVTLAATVLGVAAPRSFAVSLVRSASLVLQGVWFLAMGVMLWTPALLPKGCFLSREDGHDVARCRADDGGDALARAKALVNLEFSWYLSGTVVLVVALYLRLCRLYPEEPRYMPLVRGDCRDDDDDGGGDGDDNDVEAGKGGAGHVLREPLEIARP
uniref:Uncharacterized protein n=1 Tax=Oryza barthii TaxID=65489 RepID=A0A0D3H151_9ORYZ